MVAGTQCIHLQVSSINAYYKTTWHQHMTQYEVNKYSLGHHKRRRLYITVWAVEIKMVILGWTNSFQLGQLNQRTDYVHPATSSLLHTSARAHPQLSANAYLGVLSQRVRQSQRKAVHSPPSLHSLFHTLPWCENYTLFHTVMISKKRIKYFVQIMSWK